MPGSDARALLAHYGCKSAYSDDQDIVTHFVISRSNFDMMFKTQGISADLIVAQLQAAYPVLLLFELKADDQANVFCRAESPRGFCLEIRPQTPAAFFTLRSIAVLNKMNFD